MGIGHRGSDGHKVVPVATAEMFRRVYLPACELFWLEEPLLASRQAIDVNR